jgi:HicB family
MSALTIRLPESLHKGIKALARREGYSINQFLATAAAEKMSALMTVEYLREEAVQANPTDFENFLKQVPSCEPIETDRAYGEGEGRWGSFLDEAKRGGFRGRGGRRGGKWEEVFHCQATKSIKVLDRKKPEPQPSLRVLCSSAPSAPSALKSSSSDGQIIFPSPQSFKT